MEDILGSAKQLSTRRMTILLIAGAAVIAVIAGIFITMARPQMSLLFTDLSESDAAGIVMNLEQEGIPVQLSADGRSIYAPKDRITRLRMDLAQEGLPAGGTVGYEIFDNANAMGLTSFMQNVSRVRALEGELSRTIQSLASVDSARVHLVLGTRDPFSREAPKPSASVVVRMRGAMTLDSSQAASIRHLVASAVPNLMPTGVSVLDARLGTVFAEESGDFAGAASVDGLKRSIETRLAAAVESILTPTVGPGKVRVSVAADLSTEKAVEREMLFDPRQTAVRSRQVVDETETARENATDPPVTVEQNLPEADIDSDVAAKQRSETERSEQVTNFEISSTERERTIEPGAIQRLSVSVLVDHQRTTDAEGNVVTEPRSEAELAQIENLVRSAVGFSSARGDSITIENMAFIDLDESFVGAPPVSLKEAVVNNIDSITKAGMLLVFGIVIVFGIVRPAMSKLLAESAANSNDPETVSMEEIGAEGGTTTAADGTEIPNEERLSLPKQTMDQTLNQMLELRDVDGKVRASSVHKLGQIADQYPEEVVAILRNWIYEDAA